MKVEIKDYGIELTGENREEDAVINRFWKGGVKKAGIHPRPPSTVGWTLLLTFADLIKDKDEGKGIRLLEGKEEIKGINFMYA